MDGLNQSSQAQQTPPPQQTDHNKQSRQVSDKQASDFADRMVKEKKEKEKKGDTKDQSLESLMAERSKTGKGAVGERKEKEQGSGEGQSQFGKDQSEQALASASQAQSKADNQIREMQQASSVKEINATLKKMADQIQVSAKDAINGAEIRISLKDNILPGTEIRIQRHGGELTVTLNTTSAEANNFLAQHEASLQKSLAERFSNEKVQVNINMSGGDNQQDDGRSRNQYVAEDNDQDSSSQPPRA
ncbi:MAG: type III secretion HpaP family protein [Endozoicomonas sp.]